VHNVEQTDSNLIDSSDVRLVSLLCMSEDEQVFLIGLRMNSVERVVLQKVQTSTTTLAVHNNESKFMGVVT
jgi:hypothetical protein